MVTEAALVLIIVAALWTLYRWRPGRSVYTLFALLPTHYRALQTRPEPATVRLHGRTRR